MPLDRAHMTLASRIMVPTYVLFFTVIGLNFAFANTPRLFGTPMLRYANELVPIRVWGAMFLGCALIMAGSMLAGDRFWYRYGLMVCCVSMLIWAGVAIAGIWAEPVSYSAWVWPAFVAAACAATDKSLERNERDQRQGY